MIFHNYKFFKSIFLLIFTTFLLTACGGGLKLPGGDARKNPPNAADRVKKNLEEGRGFRINDAIKNKSGSGNFEFATSNELWRASLDVIDFMPLASANYSGGILITDWYSDGKNQNESIKINIRFLSNEIRSDALDVDIFYRTCDVNSNCVIEKKESELQQEIIKQVLQKATVYKNQQKDKNFTPYPKIKN